MSAKPTQEEQSQSGHAEKKQIGRYRLAYEIASGGQASIYMAVADGPSGFGKVVALKRLHRHLAKDPSFVSMFLDEARLAAQLTHPNVCGVIDFGVEDGEHFMAMEYLTGVTVAKLASQAQRLASSGELDRATWVRLVAYVVASAADGLRAAHELLGARGEKLNVVHRDVSPQNVMVGFDGSVRVMDFGIAKYDERETETALGEVKGKYAYMSPEQARGGTIDRRTDVWALGVIAWELLTLRRLFKRETTAQTAVAVLGDPIEPPSSVEPSVPAALDAIVLAALDRDLDARTADARTLGAALRKAAGGEFDATDLAAFVKTSFPTAEAQARTMIDLARQSASVPSIANKRDGEGSNGSLDVPVHVAPITPPPLRGPSATTIGGIAVLALLGVGAAVLGVQMASSDDAAPETTPDASMAAVPADAAVTPDASVTAAVAIAPTSETSTDVAPSAGHEAPVEVASIGPRRRDPSPPPTSQAPRSDPPARTETPPIEPPPSEPARTEAERRAPEPAGVGTLVVVTPGTWANVFGPRGDLWGQTPLRRQLPPGPLELELRFEGQPPGRHVTVTMTVGETTRVSERP